MNPTPRIWPALLATFAGSLLAQLLGLAGGAAVVLAMALLDPSQAQGLVEMGQRGEMPLAAFVGMLFGSALAFGGLPLLLAWRSPVPLAQRLGLNAGQLRPAVLFPVALVALAAGQTCLGLIVALFGAESYAFLAPVGDMIQQGSGPSKVAMVLVGSLLVGTAEELLFRGYLQRRLLERWSPVVAIGVSSLLFVLAHGSLLYALTIAPIALWLGYVAWRADSVVPSAMAHVFNNFVLFGLNALADGEPAEEYAWLRLLMWSCLLAGSLALSLWLEPRLWPGRSERSRPGVAPVHGAVGS